MFRNNMIFFMSRMIMTCNTSRIKWGISMWCCLQNNITLFNKFWQSSSLNFWIKILIKQWKKIKISS